MWPNRESRALGQPNNDTGIALTCVIGVDTLADMRHTNVKLPDDLYAKLRHEAARRGSTTAEVVREAIAAHLGREERRLPNPGSAISEVTREAIEANVGGVVPRRLIAAKAGRSGRRDTAHRIEEILRLKVRRSR